MASSRNYRPRPIDVRKVMPVMRDLHLPPVPRPEEIGVEGDDRRGGSAGSYGMSSEDAEEKNFVIAFQAAVQAALAGKSGAGACPLSRAASLARHSPPVAQISALFPARDHSTHVHSRSR
jgi:hypothetical protein